MTPADSTPMDEEWVDEAAGPFVRPYAITRGRTQPVHGIFDLIAIVVSTSTTPSTAAALGPEHLQIVRLCRQPLSVAEVSAYTNLPLGTVRVMLDDLLNARLIQVHTSRTADTSDHDIIEALIDGLRHI